MILVANYRMVELQLFGSITNFQKRVEVVLFLKARFTDYRREQSAYPDYKYYCAIQNNISDCLHNVTSITYPIYSAPLSCACDSNLKAIVENNDYNPYSLEILKFTFFNLI